MGMRHSSKMMAHIQEQPTCTRNADQESESGKRIRKATQGSGSGGGSGRWHVSGGRREKEFPLLGERAG